MSPLEMSRDMKLAELRASQAPGMRRATRAVIEAIERELILAGDEIAAGVRAAKKKQASFTATAAWTQGKRDLLKCLISVRVRTPREPLELAFHLDEDQQLALGFPPGYDEQAEDEGGDDAEREESRVEAHDAD